MSPEEIKRGLEVARDNSIFEDELANPTGNAILIVLKPAMHKLALKWEECHGDMLMLKLAYDSSDLKDTDDDDE